MEGGGSPINQSTKQPCLPGCGKREEAINTNLETAFKHQFQARPWARRWGDNSEKVLLHSRNRQSLGGAWKRPSNRQVGITPERCPVQASPV